MAAELAVKPSAPEVGARTATFSAIRFAAFLSGVVAVCFHRVLLGWETFFYRDFGVLAFPTIHHAHEAFWRGELPLWNPLSNCGVPFLAQWGTMVLYPFSLVYLVLPLPWSLHVFCLGHLVLAGLGMYRLAERWTGNCWAAGLAGTVFVFNGVTLSSLMWPNYCVALGWMPWVVLCVETAWRAPNRRHFALASLVSALQILAGVPEISLMTWAFLACFGAGRAVTQAISPKVVVLATILIVGCVTALVVVQILPFLDLLAHSQRDRGAATAKWTFPSAGWGGFVNPLFRCAENSQGVFFQLGQEFFASTYLGVIPLILGLLAVVLERRKRIWFLAGAAVVALLLAAGEGSFVYQAARVVLTGVGVIRYPVKFVMLVSFILPLLAAYGLCAIQRCTANSRWLFGVAAMVFFGVLATLGLTRWDPTPYDQWRVVLQSAGWRIGFAAVFLVLMVRGIRRSGSDAVPGALRSATIGVALLVLCVLDALVATPKKDLTLPSSVMTPGLWELHHHTPPPRFGEGRIMISPEAEAQLLVSRVRDLQADFVGKRVAEWSHLNLLDGIAKVNGSSTLQLREQKQVETLLYDTTNSSPGPLIDFLNVVYLTAPGKVIDWSQRQSAMPLLTVGQAPLYLDAPESLRVVASPTFDPQATVCLPSSARVSVTVTNRTEAKISNVQLDTHRIACEVDANSPSLVVVAQTFYHPWHATVDGIPTPLFRANHAFQALQVPAGHHRVDLIYQDRQFQIGASISGVGWAAVLSILLSDWVARRRRRNG